MTNPNNTAVNAQERNARRQVAKALRKVLSGDRLDGFRNSNEDSNLDLLGRYGWDVALSATFYPALRVCEVLLRNSVHAAIATRYPEPGGAKTCLPALVDQRTPHPCSVSWLDRVPPLLLPDNAATVQKARHRLHLRCARTKQPYTAGRLIAELNLNFWVALFSAPYGFGGESHLDLWPDLLRTTFPHAPAAETTNRSRTAGRLNQIKELRNRVFHHEPIWRRDLIAEHENILDVIGHISPLARVVLERNSTLDVVMRSSYPRLMRSRILPPA